MNYDYDQQDWGAQKVFPDGALSGVWTPTQDVVHYGGNAVTDAYAGVAREMQVLRIYEQSHLSRGWRAIAYTGAVGNSGATYRLRGENPPGATKGHNSYTRAWLWIGGGTQEPTGAAYASMKRLITNPVHPHSYYRPTACPGDYWRDWITDFDSRTDEGDIMPRILFEGMIDALFAADGEFQPAAGHTTEEGAQFWKDLIDDPTNWQWGAHFWPAWARMIRA